ncbi:MAG: thermonuclease family protein [Nitrosomonas sp.]|nr:MAG: thermonuclease family protein [Nitrosomonas sp.]
MIHHPHHCRIAVLWLLIAVMPVHASAVYRYVDDQGRVTYSDRPSAGAQPIQVDTRIHRQLYQVDKVYDGDTIMLEGGKSVRLLGVNTPEIQSRVRNEEPGGTVAKKWLQDLLQGQEVFLEFDQEKKDKYKRQLAHVFLANGKHINLTLVENGLGTLSIIPPNLRYSVQLIHAQQHAEKNKLGIWSMPEYQPHPIAEIANHTQGWQRFIGSPNSVKANKKYTRLIFTDKIDVRIANTNLKLFPDISIYLGKSMEIRGWVARKKDHYTILIQHPSSLVMQ